MAKKIYDLAVIGGGPAGLRAALQASKLGASAVVIDRRAKPGGVCLNSGTIPSKTLREAVLFFVGHKQRRFGPTEGRTIGLGDLRSRINIVLEHEYKVIDKQLGRNNVEQLFGQARFINSNEVELSTLEDGATATVEAKNFLIATGSVPRRPDDIPFDQHTIFDSNFLFSSRNTRTELPRSMIIMGAGVIGTEYACMFAALGCEVWLIDRRTDLMRFVDRTIAELLRSEVEALGVKLKLGFTHTGIRRTEHGVTVDLDDGQSLNADSLLFCQGRLACTAPLDLDNTRVQCTDRGCIKVDEHYRTDDPSIYAAGDVIGFPALASTSFEQGRVAAAHALGIEAVSHPEVFPYGIYTIPEISMVGKTEQELQEAGTKYAVGVASYSEVAKASMAGCLVGGLKIIFDPESKRLLGVHCIGEQATELIHIGQTAMALGGTLDFFVNNVFNYPTLAEAYKTAALNGLNVLQGTTTTKTL